MHSWLDEHINFVSLTLFKMAWMRSTVDERGPHAPSDGSPTMG